LKSVKGARCSQGKKSLLGKICRKKGSVRLRRKRKRRSTFLKVIGKYLKAGIRGKMRGNGHNKPGGKEIGVNTHITGDLETEKREKRGDRTRGKKSLIARRKNLD